MDKGKWIAIISGLLMLLCFPFYFLYFIDYEVTRYINNDKLIACLLFVPFIIDAFILYACRSKGHKRPTSYKIFYYANVMVFNILLVVYVLIILATDGFNTQNFTLYYFDNLSFLHLCYSGHSYYFPGSNLIVEHCIYIEALTK